MAAKLLPSFSSLLPMRLFSSLFLAILLLATACTTTFSGRRHAAFWRTNGYDRLGEQQGRWRTYYDDDDKSRPQTWGRFRHGRPVGHWRYYGQPGNLDHEERYHGEFSDMVFYYPNGQVARRGRSRIADEHPNVHYFWLGDWQEYSDTGELLRTDTYEHGKLVSTKDARAEAKPTIPAGK